jgi:acetolactate synthase I/II/III large subunit
VKGYQAIPELLRRGGIPVVFAMLGGTNMPWIAEGERLGTLRLVRTRHEETAVNAAAGYAKSTGSIGLCSVTRGPGFANSINAMTATARNHLPVLLLVGESPTVERTTQQLDQKALAHTIGAGFQHAGTGDELEPVFWSAYRAAWRNGSVQVISMANRVLGTEVTLEGAGAAELRTSSGTPDPATITTVAQALRRARRPLIVAGQGAALAGCRGDLEVLAERSGAALATSLVANHFFAGHRNTLGLCGGWAPTRSRKLIQSSDLVLAFGASLNGFTTDEGRMFDSSATVVICDVDEPAPELAGNPVLTLKADAGRAVAALLEEWNGFGVPDGEPWADRLTFAENKVSILECDIGHDPTHGIDPRQVFEAIDRIFPPNRVVAADSGRSVGGAMPAIVDACDSRSFLIGNSFSSIGRGLGIAIGAAAANPDRPVVLFAGDGGFAMSMQDLDAVRLSRLDLTIVIMNDRQYGSEVKYLLEHGLPMDVISQHLPDIPLLAKAFGGEGHVITTIDQLDDLNLPSPGLVILDVRIDPNADVRRSVGW